MHHIKGRQGGTSERRRVVVLNIPKSWCIVKLPWIRTICIFTEAAWHGYEIVLKPRAGCMQVTWDRKTFAWYPPPAWTGRRGKKKKNIIWLIFFLAISWWWADASTSRAVNWCILVGILELLTLGFKSVNKSRYWNTRIPLTYLLNIQIDNARGLPEPPWRCLNIELVFKFKLPIPGLYWSPIIDVSPHPVS